MTDRPVFTFQARLPSAVDAVLSAYAELFGKAERSLFAALQADRSLNDLKREFQPRFGITARQFNAVRVGLDGKIASIKARRPELIDESKTRIAKAERVIRKLAQNAAGSNKLRQKKRRLITLKSRLAKMESDHESGKVRLCFGSKKLFRAQFALAANGYCDHGSWLKDWQRERSCQFFVLGSKDEITGNQTCQATTEQNGSLSLKLRLPDALASFGKYLTIPEVRFAYGQTELVAALNTSKTMTSVNKQGKPIRRRTGSAISYRFVRDRKGWRVFASVESVSTKQTTSQLAGAVGVDINADHLAVAETDRFGNLIKVRRIDLHLYGKTTDQAKALIGDAVTEIAEMAASAGKPVVCEKLNFQRKKAELETTSPTQARMISSFACTKIISGLKSAGFRRGVEIIEVNPAYTSVIGAVNHAQSKGISVHQGAALAVARRGLGLSERPIGRKAVVPVRHGGHVTFELPVRNRSKHVWSHWSAVRIRLRAAHVVHYRSGLSKEKPAPLSPEMRALGSIRSSMAKLRGANRFQNCLGSVVDDVPW